MEEDWKTYCLMSGIIFIEEMNKPTGYISKEGYYQHRSLRLKMNDKSTIDRLHRITKNWQQKKNVQLLGKSFKVPRKENYSGQYNFDFSPAWLFEVLNTTKGLPSKYTYNIAIKRLKNWRKTRGAKVLNQVQIKSLVKDSSCYKLLLKDKQLAAGAIVVSLDLEFRGVHSGNSSLCMSNTYKDFLEFMLKVANYYGWSTTDYLKKVSVAYSRSRGIDATDQSEFNLKISSLKEIYELAGPLLDKGKDKAIRHHIKRSSNYINLGGKFRKKNTRTKILKLVNKLEKTKTTELQYYVNIGTDVILDHLHILEKKGYVKKERQGKRYIWSPSNGNKPGL